MQSSITEIHNSRFFLKRILSLAAKTKRRYYDVEKTSIYGLIGTLAYSGWVPIIGTLATALKKSKQSKNEKRCLIRVIPMLIQINGKRKIAVKAM